MVSFMDFDAVGFSVFALVFLTDTDVVAIKVSKAMHFAVGYWCLMNFIFGDRS